MTVNASAQTFDPSNRQDCAAVRTTLELARSGETDPAALLDAVRHLEDCAACQTAVRRQTELDDRIGAVCCDVPVPDDLRARLLASLERPALPTAEPAGATKCAEIVRRPATGAVPRRRWARWALALAAACVLAGVWGVWRLAAPPLSLEGLIAQTETASPMLPECEKRDWPPLPATMNTRFLVEAPRELPGGPAAVYFFAIPPSRGRPAVQGRLLAVPVSRLGKPPAGTGFLSRAAVYRGLGFCASSWVEGDFAYVCLVEGGERELHLLERARPAAI
ncbi:MAG TPA: hypothetical protein VL475_02060 [Planctomycetaceae bacterium]|nr:hypothetical protein [Planctomycetaceae bacterium]